MMSRKLPPLTLEYQLCEALVPHAGERGDNEGAVDTLYRIIHERDRALMILALDRLSSHRPLFAPADIKEVLLRTDAMKKIWRRKLRRNSRKK